MEEPLAELPFSFNNYVEEDVTKQDARYKELQEKTKKETTTTKKEETDPQRAYFLDLAETMIAQAQQKQKEVAQLMKQMDAAKKAGDKSALVDLYGKAYQAQQKKEQDWESVFDKFDRMEAAKNDYTIIELSDGKTKKTQLELEDELVRRINLL